MRRRNGGFTVLELLAVIGIMLVLATMLFIAIRVLGRQSQTNSTKVRLQSVVGMLHEYEAGPGLAAVKAIYTPPGYATAITGAADVNDGTAARYHDVTVTNTQLVYTTLIRLPTIKGEFQRMPTSQFLPKETPASSPPSPPIMVDAYNNPIIFVPAGGLTVTFSGGATKTITAPDGKGFWASAGPDGSFSLGDDNIYSFDK